MRTNPIAIAIIALVVGIGIGVGDFALVTDDDDPAPGAGTPRQPLEGWKNEPTDLACQASYTAPAANQTHSNEIGINFEARFTEGAYAEWKDEDAGTTGAGLASGAVTGIGAEGYWHTVIIDPETETSYGGGDYIVAVQDSNVAVRVRIAVLRQPGEPAVSWDEVGAMAKAQVKRALDGLSA